MAKLCITVEFDVSGPGARDARDAIEAALDAGTIQDAIKDAAESTSEGEDEDQLDFSVQAGIFKRRTWLGKLTHLVTFPFAKLLLEFHVHGPAGHPAWDYRGILERISDSMGESAGVKKDAAPQ